MNPERLLVRPRASPPKRPSSKTPAPCQPHRCSSYSRLKAQAGSMASSPSQRPSSLRWRGSLSSAASSTSRGSCLDAPTKTRASKSGACANASPLCLQNDRLKPTCQVIYGIGRLLRLGARGISPATLGTARGRLTIHKPIPHNLTSPSSAQASLQPLTTLCLRHATPSPPTQRT